jgi:F0F1-type ATP synthase membrane subunit b/b'
MTGPFLLLVANERPLINVDVTLLINLGLWFALFLFLRATFWGPMLALITAREEGTEGSRAEATRLDAEAKKLRAELDARTKEARQVALRQREALRVEGLRQEAELTTKVRAEVADDLTRRRAELATQREALRAEVKSVVPGLARDIAARVLRREVSL